MLVDIYKFLTLLKSSRVSAQRRAEIDQALSKTDHHWVLQTRSSQGY